MAEIHHWLKQTPWNSPSSRGYPGMATIYGTDKAVLFGGQWHLEDTWEYDFSNNTWTDKSPSPRPSNYPPSRFYPKLASVYGDDKAVMFGGYHPNYLLDDTWVYDSSDGGWIEPNPAVKPPGSYVCEVVSIWGDDKVLLFGGESLPPSTYYNATWIYDVDENTWTNKSPPNSPSCGVNHAMAPIWGDDKVVLFGGAIESWTEFQDDTWVYDLDSNTWTNKMPTGAKPKARGGHGMVSIRGDDKVLLFGGFSEHTAYLDDTWIYDLSENKWTEIVPYDPAFKPSVLAGPGMALIDGTDKIVLFGGTTGGSNSKSDTWIYKHYLYTRNGTYTSEPYDTGSNSSFDKISWFADIPENTSIKVQLRSAANESLLVTKPFVGPDGTPSTNYTTTPSDIWFGHHSDRWMQYKVYFNIDVVTNSPSLKDITISYNCLPRTIVIGPSNGSLLASNKPIFKWEFFDFDSDEQKAFQIVISDDITFTKILYDTDEQVTKELTWEFPTGTNYTELPDGTWFWKVRTKDDDDAWTEFSEPWCLRIDTNRPSSTPTIPINNGYYNSLTQISGLATDPLNGSGIFKIELAIKRLSDNYYWDGVTWVSLMTWLLASGTTEWTYDTTSITWESGIRYAVQSRAIDFCANIETPDSENIFGMDMTEPSSLIETPLDDTWLNGVQTISGSSVDKGGADVERVEICIKCIRDENVWDEFAKVNDYWDGKKWNVIRSWLTVTGTNKWSYNSSAINWATGNQYLIRSRATDNTGNLELPGSGIRFSYDDTPPNATLISINNGDEFTRTRDIVLSVEADDVGSGCTHMSFSADGLTWSAWEEFNNTKEDFTLTTMDGEKRIYFKVKDLAGNIAEPVSTSIIFDSTPPNDLSIKINNGDKYTNSNLVNLTFTAEDSGSGISDYALSYNGNFWLPWESYKSTRRISITTNDGDGEKNIYFKVSDKAGNIAKPVLTSIILDTTPPESLSIIINGGQDKTKLTYVNLRLTAVDSISGVYQISFSDDNITWTAWENYTETRIYNLPPGDGKKTIYFRASDHAGNIAEPILSTIILNTSSTPPAKAKEKSSPIESNLSFMILIIFIIIVAIIIAVIAVTFKRRKKEEEQKLLPTAALTIKPRVLGAPMLSYGQVPPVSKVPKLPGISVSGTVKPPTQPPSTVVPQLPKSTETMQVSVSQPKIALPQLPPARLPSTQPEHIEPTPVPTIATQQSTPKPALAPTLKHTTQPKPQAASASAVSETPESKPSPTVRLPES